jgi:hypothetical protein
MRLCFPHDVPRIGVTQTFRRSVAAPGAVALASLAFAVVWLTRVAASGDGVFVWLPAVAALIVAGFSFGMFSAALRPTNWLLKTGPDGLYLKFRSYLNYHFPDTTPYIAFIRFAEIAHVRAVTQRQRLPARNGDTTPGIIRFLDIRLNHGQTAEFQRALAEERRHFIAKWGGRIRTRHRDYPVAVPEPGLVRIAWNVPPRAERAAAELAPWTTVRPPEELEERNWETMTSEARESLIVELAMRGDVMTATHLARMHYDIGLAEAKRIVEAMADQ